ncbi:MAG: hypothetical protein FK730_09035 [Asgard group archaeon]|nr:hypothetical protein [Asgard group archaeon]
MPLKNASVHKSGILINEKNRKTLIVPFQISLSPDFNRNNKFHSELNRQIYYILSPATKRYTIFFDRSNTNKPIIKINAYFSTLTLQGLYKLAKQTMQRLKNHLNNNGLIVKILAPNKVYQNILSKLPKKVDEIDSNIYKIITSKTTTYLSIAKIYYEPEEEKNDLSIFLRDFYAIANIGTVNLDISYDSSKKDSKQKILVAISILLEDSNLDEIIQNQRKLQSLLSIFSNQAVDTKTLNYWFVKKDELLRNYGKIILGQGWKTFQVELAFLNFASYFNLLIDIN